MIYLDLIRYSFLRFFSYPLEIVASIAKRIIEILFLILFWSIIVRDNPNINLTQIVSYFFISVGIRDLVMSHWGPFGGFIGNSIKSGQINNYMLKPVKLIPLLYSISLGRSGIRVLLAIANLTVGLIIFPPKSAVSIFLFIIFFICAWFISFAYNLFQGTLYFRFSDASGIRNALNNIIRVFSGELIPIFFFPEALKNITLLSPFPGMIYLPTIALSINSITYDVIKNIIVTVFWVLILNLLAYLYWRRAIKNYEAIGI